MNRDEYRHLLAERGALERILAGIPEEDVLDRGSFRSRLEEVEDRIAAAGAGMRAPAQARLTYRGRPVVDAHGVFADFGTRATRDFVDAVSLMAAALTTPLAPTGPIPNRDQNQLLITSTAVGSFGFELEEFREYRGGQLPLELDEETPVAQALAQTLELLRSTLGSEDELADAAAVLDLRAVAAVRMFLDTLVTYEAVCALELNNDEASFRFTDVGQVRLSLERLGQDNLREEQQSFLGEFQGVLPKRRIFEFRLAEGEDVISGKVGSGIVDPDVLNQHVHQSARIQVTAVLVGSGRPRYVLNELPEWSSQSALPRPASH